MITVSGIDMTGFNRGIAGLIYRAGIAAKTVIAKETGELIKTLVRISPPKDRAKSRASIVGQVTTRFQKLNQQQNNFESLEAKEGRTGIKWYAADSKFLFGGARESDFTKASTNELRQVYYRIKKKEGSYRIITDFKNRKTSQRVAIATRILATEKQLKKVIAKIQKNFGRLKAGWMAAVWKGPIRITGGYQPPQWVTNHNTPGQRGTFIPELENKDKPAFTIINRAKGVTKNSQNYFIQSAVKIRAKAMAANLKYYLSGKKNLADYAKN